MAERLVDKLSIAIQMLNYAIDNDKSLTETCIKFKRSEKFLRALRKNAKPTNNAETNSYNTFLKKYNEFLGKNNLNIKDEIVSEIKDALNGGNEDNESDDLLGKDTVLDTDESQTRTETDDTLEFDYRGKEIIKSSEKLLEAADVDLDLWKLEREVVNKWDVTMKMKDDSIQTAQNFQVKVWLTKKHDVAEVFNAADKFKELLDGYTSPQYDPSDFAVKKGDEKNLLEINIFDLHIGKLAWAGETGENYDVKIASRRFMTALSKLLERANAFQFEKILFPVGNDFFNSDTILNTTTSGTPQDEDLRWQKTFKLGLELLVKGIDMMRQYAPVDVVLIPGNHDETRSFFLGESLSAWYRNDADVSVNTHASPRKYYKYGEVLLGLTHGNNEKEAALPQIMAVENRKDWANSTFHEWHLGHFHKKKTVRYQVLDENLGVTVRYLSSLTGKDAWHHKKGYVGSNKAAEAFLWNHENGFIGQFNVNIVDEDCE
jgi:hypothetical protein